MTWNTGSPLNSEETGVPLAMSPDTAGKILQDIYDYIAQEFGVVFLLASVAVNGFLIWLAISRYGKAKMGAPEQEPEFDTFSWPGLALQSLTKSWNDSHRALPLTANGIGCHSTRPR